jgi:hypothetical protein
MLSAAGGVVWVMEVLIGVIRIKKEFIVLIIITIILFVSELRRVTLALVMHRQVLIIIGNTCVYARDQRLAWNTST